MVFVLIVDIIILYIVVGYFGGGEIFFKLVSVGFGVIVGGFVCVVLEFVGVVDVFFKLFGFNILINMVCVIIDGIK